MKTSSINPFGRPVAIAAVAVMAWVQPLSAGSGDPEVAAKAVVIHGEPAVIWQGKHVVEIRVDGGEVKVRLDGQDLPSSRIRNEDGQIIILGEDGDELKAFKFHVPQESDDFEFSFDWPGTGEDFGHAWNDAPENPPAVMIGIHMCEPDEALRYHLRLDEGATTMICGIYEDLPAGNAGLDRFDIIVAVEGNRPADPESVRAVLAEKQPGDTIAFTVIHEGRSRDVEVELAAYDAGQLDESRLIGGVPQPGAPEGGLLFQGPGEKQWQHYLFDPNTQQYFLKWFDSEQMQDLSDAVRKHLPDDLDDRMHDLNERIDQLQEMIDELLEQGRTGGGTGSKRTQAPLMARAD